jgi:hypothetical protein
MSELRFALDPAIASAARVGKPDGALTVPRGILLWSIVAHLAGVYVMARWSLDPPAPLPRPPLPELVWAAEILPNVPEPIDAPDPEPVPPLVEPRAAPERSVQTDVPAPPALEEQSAEPAAVADAPRLLDFRDEIGEPVTPTDLVERRRRAAADVIAARTREDGHLTFTLDDVAPPRAVAASEPERTIFDGTGQPIGPSVGQVGQARTKLGHRLSELCNALTGGFSLMGWGSFCAPAADGGYSGLFPEVRPWYLDALPECVETRPLDEELGEATAFPTVKCRLVRPPDAPPLAVRELD